MVRVLNKVIILIIITSSLFTSISISPGHKTTICLNDANNVEQHLIKDVPFVNYNFSGARCPYISTTMICKYYGINTTVSEVVHHLGGGYSYSYQKVYPLRLWSGYMISGGPDDCRFLADLFGLEYEYWYTISDSRSNQCWAQYWEKIKQNITQDIPVITMTCFNDLNNISSEYYIPDFMVVVGFNESNETICCHIPYQGAFQYYSIDTVKNAIFQIHISENIYRTVYHFLIFKNIIDQPLNKKECFQRAHERNIQKMKGNKTVYDEEIFQRYFGFRIFGINALQSLKQDITLFNILLYNALPDIHFLSPWTSISAYWMIYEEKYEIAQYLKENYLFSPKICLWDAQHLELEAQLILHFIHLMFDLNQTLSNNTGIVTFLRSYPIIKDIRNTIDTMISVEKAIIKGSF